MKDSPWTYRESDGSIEAPPQDGDSTVSVPVVAWFTETPKDIDSGEHHVVVAVLAFNKEDGRWTDAIGWFCFDKEGSYDCESFDSEQPFCWIERHMDASELDREKNRQSGLPDPKRLY